jgi:hypothetical protein
MASKKTPAKKKPAAEKEMITETCPWCGGAGKLTCEKPTEPPPNVPEERPRAAAPALESRRSSGARSHSPALTPKPRK